MNQNVLVRELQYIGVEPTQYNSILTDEAKAFIIQLHEKFDRRRLDLLAERTVAQKHFDAGNFPAFPEETKAIREGDWVCAELPYDLLDRRVEITGPVDRKMIINALNSGAKMFMADFEDSNAPTIDNVLAGQVNLRDAVNKTISYHHPTKNKTYTLYSQTATLLVRPRGLHLNEKHFIIDGKEVSASLVDFGLYFFHNIQTLLAQGSATYFYLPKLEHYLEARWWNDVFVFAQDYMHVPQRSIKATVLIETITASFQLDEIMFELRDHMAGLNCGRWDYIFSYIKKFKNHPNFFVPDRAQITMETPFMEAYSLRVIQRCHKRGVHAIGGMAAQIPVKGDEAANAVAFEKVRKGKEREVKNGHDGTWVAHPGLVSLALDIFNEHMLTRNQIHVKRNDIRVSEDDLVEKPTGIITEKGIRENINVGILYIESWLNGQGAAALYHLMEDAATAEISRTQLWLWLHKGCTTDAGTTIDKEAYEKYKKEEIEKIKQLYGEERYANGKFELAIQLFDQLVLSEEFEEFLTIPAYQYL